MACVEARETEGIKMIDNGDAVGSAPQFDLSDAAFAGPFREPFRAEVDVRDLLVEGRVPAELDGAFYRLGADQAYAPRPHTNHMPIVAGDGMLTMFAIRDGRVHFRSRYVQTEKLMLERAAGKALFGGYRNPYEDDPSVQGHSRVTANTTVVEHAGLLWALKEDGPPVQVHVRWADDEQDDDRAPEVRPPHRRDAVLRRRGQGRDDS
jgi:carotenoid cleavage dioxygenase-like enzyme